jgi:hypothetical protein
MPNKLKPEVEVVVSEKLYAWHWKVWADYLK